MSSVAKKLAIPIEFDLETGIITSRGSQGMPLQEESLSAYFASAITESLPALCTLKEGDRVPLLVKFYKGGQSAGAMDLLTLKAGIKEFEPEALVSLNDTDGDDFLEVTYEGEVGYLIPLDITADKVGAILANYEADEATYLHMPFEIEATFDGNATVELVDGEFSEGHSVLGSYLDSSTFGFDLDGAEGDFRLTIRLQFSEVTGYPIIAGQNITTVYEFSAESGSPYTLSDATGALAGAGAASSVNWRSATDGTLTPTNNGVDLDLDVSASAHAISLIPIGLPDTGNGSPPLASYYFFSSASPGYIYDYGVPGSLIVRLKNSATVLHTYTWKQTSPGVNEFANLSQLCALIAADLGVSCTFSMISSGQYGAANIIIADATPGIDEINIEVGGSAGVDYAVQSFANGLSYPGTVTVTLEQTGGASLPSGPLYEDFVKTSQTAALRLERDLIPND